MDIKGAVVGVFVEKDYQDLEVWYPALRLREAGATVLLIGATSREYKGKYGYPAVADRLAAEVTAGDLDALLIPGGWAPDFLRRHESVLRLVRDIYSAGKPLAAICHAGWVLASADVLRGRTVTSFSAIRTDLVNAGALWVDQDVVVDGPLITARTPEDLPAFTRALIKAVASGRKS